ncbi:MAG: glycosyltransferase, partial [Stenotrophomonas nitritireducens]|nr:glycosyltransferase [Stenotrophomonas nitritireducens]
GAAVAAAQVRGFQSALDSGEGVIAGPKHFAGYGAARGGRDYDDSEISDSELHNVYLPPFRAAVEAGAGNIMSAYMDLNGVPASGNRWLMTDILRDEFGFDDDDVVVGCVAVLREPKGHLDLLDAIAPLCRENPKLHLLIIGDGEPVMSRLKASSAQYGIERQIHLPGYRNDAARLMAGFDVFALPSHKEAAGTVFLEAAEAGVPIVATRVGGIPEMLVEQVNALLVELGDQAALTAALRTLATSGELRRKMGRAGREWLHQEHRFTVAGHCEATEHHYHQWLEELGHGPRQVGTGADAPPRQPVAGHDHGLPGKL